MTNISRQLLRVPYAGQSPRPDYAALHRVTQRPRLFHTEVRLPYAAIPRMRQRISSPREGTLRGRRATPSTTREWTTLALLNLSHVLMAYQVRPGVIDRKVVFPLLLLPLFLVNTAIWSAHLKSRLQHLKGANRRLYRESSGWKVVCIFTYMGAVLLLYRIWNVASNQFRLFLLKH